MASSEEALPEYLKSTASGRAVGAGRRAAYPGGRSVRLSWNATRLERGQALSLERERMAVRRGFRTIFYRGGARSTEGATVCYRALMGDRPLPESVRPLFDENPPSRQTSRRVIERSST